ncbi:MAG: S41 family peptidase [Bacteroidetes bacterium]|nr:S41 family peptidase [Bacteroidota bacterium]
MDENIKSNNKYLPIIFSFVLIIGILLGILLSGTLQNKNLFSAKNKQYDKINDVINFALQDYVDTISKDKLQEKAITGMLESLDPHSVYISSEEFNEVNDPLMGNFEGIGVQFRIQNDSIMVVNTVSGGPSEKVGLRAGDRIVKVDGKNVARIGIKDTDVIKKLKGKKGSTVNVSIYRRDVKHLLDFNIIRDVIPTYSIDISYMVDKQIAYIKLSKFSATTIQEFSKALEELNQQGMQKLILDLRGNGGGYLQAAVVLADEFLSKGKLIVYTEGKNRPIENYYATSKGIAESKDLVILIDEWSASASEIIAGAIQDNDRGCIIGRRSFGKGLVQEQFSLSDGSAVRLTVARYHTPTGRCIQKSYKKGMNDYMNDLNQRYMNGELESADSTKFVDSLKYTTPKGKVVYGGGGIMPDIYIPLHLDKNLEYYNQLLNKGLVYQFAFEYTDKNRKLFASYRNANDFILKFDINNAIFEEFTEYVEKNGVSKNLKGYALSLDKVKILLKAFIGRNLFDDKGFYPIYLQTDNAFLKAIEQLKHKK